MASKHKRGADRPTVPSPVGRPPKEIDVRLFENCCEIQCTQTEMCCLFECNVDTLNAWCNDTYGKNFSEVYTEKRGSGKISLRRTQWQAAVEDKNTALLIFLGKQFLGQADKIEQNTVLKLEEMIPEPIEPNQEQTKKLEK